MDRIALTKNIMAPWFGGAIATSSTTAGHVQVMCVSTRSPATTLILCALGTVDASCSVIPWRNQDAILTSAMESSLIALDTVTRVITGVQTLDEEIGMTRKAFVIYTSGPHQTRLDLHVCDYLRGMIKETIRSAPEDIVERHGLTAYLASRPWIGVSVQRMYRLLGDLEIDPYEVFNDAQ
jgi:hypothetical protein